MKRKFFVPWDLVVSEVSDSTATPIEVYFVLDMLTFRKIFYPQKKTKMHSSRMRTVRCSGRPRRGVCLPHTHTYTRVNRMTDMFKNITLPQLRCGR